jgi:hypothetical protein
MAVCPNCQKQELQPGETQCPHCRNKSRGGWVKRAMIAVGSAALIALPKIILAVVNRNKGNKS